MYSRNSKSHNGHNGQGHYFQEEEKEQKAPNEVEIPMDYSIKHPLQHRWSLWYYENDRSTANWEDNLKEIASFKTVEDFWSLYNHIKLASELKHGNDYSIFKDQIRPMWEDDANKRGGRWLISLDKKQRSVELDRYWLDVILCLIGEAFENAEEVCGATVNLRGKGDKIGIWTRDVTKTGAIMEIGRKLKERLHIPQRTTIAYQTHKDSADKQGSVTKNMFTL